MYELYVIMKSGATYYYVGDEATEVFKSIEMAESRGAKWAKIKNEHGQLIYAIDNIELLRYSKQLNNGLVH